MNKQITIVVIALRSILGNKRLSFGTIREGKTNMNLNNVFGRSVIVVVGVIMLAVAAALIIYPPEYVYRTLFWQASDVFDWQKFPYHPLHAAPTPFLFDVKQDPRVEEVFQQLSGARNWNSLLEANHTQAFIVIKDGTVVYENYFNNTQRDSIVLLLRR